MTHDSRPLHVALFFSHGVSLVEWRRRGLFDREIGHYRALAARLGRITCVTYDTNEPDADVLAAAAPLAFLWNRWRLPYPVFGVLAPWLHRRVLVGVDVLRTNQLSGAWTAVLAERLLRKPLVVRCGFVGSQFYRLAGLKRWRVWLREALERWSLAAADLVFVASEADAEYLRGLCRGRTVPIVVLPNAVDTDLFAPNGTDPERGRVVFVGRLTAQKNLPLLFEAVRQDSRGSRSRLPAPASSTKSCGRSPPACRWSSSAPFPIVTCRHCWRAPRCSSFPRTTKARPRPCSRRWPPGARSWVLMHPEPVR